jgi:hypothetical protein
LALSSVRAGLGLVARLYELLGRFRGIELVSAYFDGRGCGAVGSGDVRGRFEADGDCIDVPVFDEERDPNDDRRGLVSGIPKRLCKRIRVDVGCLEVAAERDDDAMVGSGGGEGKGEWEGGEEEGGFVLVPVVG